MLVARPFLRGQQAPQTHVLLLRRVLGTDVVYALECLCFFTPFFCLIDAMASSSGIFTSLQWVVCV